MSKVNSPLIIALDYPDQASAIAMARLLDPALCRVKVGKELYTRCGPPILDALQGMGFEVFLDLKFHDIPNTTSKAVSVAADLGVWMVNVHASGGVRMMEACVEALARFRSRPLLIGVTVLTSMEGADLQGVGISRSPYQQVELLADLANESGLDGIVCSSQEVGGLRARLREDFKFVTPGIRPQSAAVDDQKRIMTPAQALNAGSSYLVVGRPVTKADDPGKALEDLMSEVNAVTG
ncbi:MAG: orotidine-5'-phosphate decarboxylase [Oleiphilus sp.]|nr:MAG: orotidine-5'-phosphate decarboxylase [Oleiphilus sp.]